MTEMLRVCARAARVTVLLAAAFFLASPALSPPTHAQRRRTTRASRNAQITAMLAEIDARNIERTIRKLVSFGTRNSLSAQDDPARGIGAARDWLFGEFQKIAAATGGRMTVELQTFEQQPGQFPRITRPTKITNVVARLNGTQSSSSRMYVVSGHYDSMCTRPIDATCDAPGANDDASGVAAVLEMARVMAKREFDA
ncbi:MAG TPA: M28 family peptidase, partial [Pyrinomonadaceae bacterium]|nr:M28 family peptidase [Pyrinomonadaceae bacterium]